MLIAFIIGVFAGLPGGFILHKQYVRRMVKLERAFRRKARGGID
jgi:hypothetical protein